MSAQEQAALNRLHDALAEMDLPDERKISAAPTDLKWLGRNMAIRNHAHPRFADAASSLRELGVQFVLD
jgi:hypothetical protein